MTENGKRANSQQHAYAMNRHLGDDTGTVAHVGVHVEHSAGEVAESQDVVALRSIHWNLAGLEGIAIQVLDVKFMARS